MAMTPEKKVKVKVMSQLKELGAYSFYPVTGGYGSSGIPDIVGCYKGLFFGIECKANGNKPTALQEMHLENIVSAGGIALVIDETNVAGLSDMLKSKLHSSENHPSKQ